MQNVPYGGSAKYTGDTPVSPDGPADDYPFEGWNPQPTNITGTTKCMAVFGSPLEIKEIEDRWDDILAACADGTYKQKYKIGNYKPLDMGTEGIINMQIAGRDVDALADGSGMAPLSWVGIELLKTGKSMNPHIVTNYDYPQMPSWAAGTGSNANLWTTQTGYCKDSVARATWTITVEEAGTVAVEYRTYSANTNYNKLSVTVNGEAIATDFAGTSYVKYPVEVQAGDTVIVEAEFTVLSGSSGTAYTGKVRLTSTGQIAIAEDIQDAPQRVLRDYQLGTGSIGGWEHSALRSYYYETLLPLIPENVRAHLKTVLKNHIAYNTEGKAFTQTTKDKVCLLSKAELFSTAGSINQPRYKALFPDNASRRKRPIDNTSAKFWWLRSTGNHNGLDCVEPSGGYYGITGAASTLCILLCFFT